MSAHVEVSSRSRVGPLHLTDLSFFIPVVHVLSAVTLVVLVVRERTRPAEAITLVAVASPSPGVPS